MNINIFITGITGFLGSHLASDFQKVLSCNVSGTSCRKRSPEAYLDVKAKGINEHTDWSDCFDKDIDVVIHTAAVAHRRDIVSDDEFQSVNYLGTVNLARQAKASGVSRFIFISSIAVNGSSTLKPFDNNSEVNPQGSYAKSKQLAEDYLLNELSSDSFKVYIVRPPLIYGDSAPGNFSRILSLMSKPIPLPLAGLNNKRSFIYIKNLIDVIKILTFKEHVPQGVFLVSDNDDISTSQFLKLVSKYSKTRAKLFSMPTFLLRLILILFRKELLLDKLSVSLQIDSATTMEELNWKPRFTVEEALRDTFNYK